MGRNRATSVASVFPCTGVQIGPDFDFTMHVRHLCEDVCTRMTEFGHIDMSRVAVCYSQARKRVRHGLHASLTPMRFANGATTGVRRGRRYTCQQLLGADGQEMLYILRFYLPRFMDEDFEEKLGTIFHELWHISPRFDGDLRRHPGRCYIHTHSEVAYNAHMKQLSREWLDRGPPDSLYRFLQKDFDQLEREHKRVVGVRIPQPKLIPLDL